MAARKKWPQINLLPQEEFAASTIGRVLAWLLTSFRIIVIISEMVVMGAFLSRFWLDAKSADLTDEIKQESAVIASFASFEKDFRAAQGKLNVFAALDKEKGFYSDLLAKIVSAQPGDVQLVSLSITGSDIQIKARSLSEAAASLFLGNLGKVSELKNLTLAQAAVEATAQNISFTVKGELEGGK